MSHILLAPRSLLRWCTCPKSPTEPINWDIAGHRIASDCATPTDLDDAKKRVNNFMLTHMCPYIAHSTYQRLSNNEKMSEWSKSKTSALPERRDPYPYHENGCVLALCLQHVTPAVGALYP
eukprot:CAMPEP_0116845820 /NCGR_PEP_ID=MMETSP0418-20121206/13492_1 /TAXON_ID=1158023 /ORGANISM="Astrosyne radiata, Strain 13vi08-1A" /LENGTH=120 /DNA_ID=CAMNT_0004476999 /DNA_START=522 /DNA_END=881 /DNA_ORIENTATION=+